MKYIYESPDKGKTVYRTPIGVPHAKRELILENDVDVTRDDILAVEFKEDGSVIVIEKANIDDLMNSYDDDPGLPAKGKQS